MKTFNLVNFVTSELSYKTCGSAMKRLSCITTKQGRENERFYTFVFITLKEVGPTIIECSGKNYCQ